MEPKRGTDTASATPQPTETGTNLNCNEGGTHDAALCAMASSSSDSSAAAQSSSSTSDKIRTRKVNNVHNAVSSYHKTYYSTILISIVFNSAKLDFSRICVSNVGIDKLAFFVTFDKTYITYNCVLFTQPYSLASNAEIDNESGNSQITKRKEEVGLVSSTFVPRVTATRVTCSPIIVNAITTVAAATIAGAAAAISTTGGSAISIKKV